MPMLKSGSNKQACMTYRFYEEQRTGWCAFWEEMDGCSCKIIDWAKNAEIEEPEQWYQSLHLFLFECFSGNEKLLKKAAKSQSFGDFLGQAIENHVNCPYDDMWYVNKGLTQCRFIAELERAAAMEDDMRAVVYLDSKIPELGGRLYCEYTLALTGWKEELMESVSMINKKAFGLEDQVFTRKFHAGQKVVHQFYPNKELEVLGVVDNKLVAKHVNGCLSVIEDVWNVETK